MTPPPSGPRRATPRAGQPAAASRAGFSRATAPTPGTSRTSGATRGTASTRSSASTREPATHHSAAMGATRGSTHRSEGSRTGATPLRSGGTRGAAPTRGAAASRSEGSRGGTTAVRSTGSRGSGPARSGAGSRAGGSAPSRAAATGSRGGAGARGGATGRSAYPRGTTSHATGGLDTSTRTSGTRGTGGLGTATRTSGNRGLGTSTRTSGTRGLGTATRASGTRGAGGLGTRVSGTGGLGTATRASGTRGAGTTRARANGSGTRAAHPGTVRARRGGATRAYAARPMARPKPPRRAPARVLRLGDPGRRLGVGLAAVCTLLVILGGRLVQLQGIDSGDLAGVAQQQRLHSTTIPATRGQILDRDGRVLAYSVAARTIFADPRQITDPAATAATLGPLLGQRPDALLPKLRKKGRTAYVPLKKNVTPEDAERILKARLAGIGSEDSTQRLYPGTDVAANVVGFTGVDGGSAGIEQRFNTQLAGTPGELLVERGSNGLEIPSGLRKETAAVAGSSVTLTLDQDLQYKAQRALADAVKAVNAKGGQLVVLDVKTGEVLAMASAPTFDAQQPGKADKDVRGNPAVQAPVEPGSANKLVTFAGALDQGLIRPDTAMLVPDGYRVPGKVVHDAWSHAPTKWTATGVLAKSSNVGTLMVAEKLGKSAFYDYERKFGIGTRTGVELPGESPGILPEPKDWSGTTFGNLPIGQGVSMTALQLAGMYQTIGNDGVRIPPRVVSSVTAPDGTVTPTRRPDGVKVVSPQAARTVRLMMEATVGEGGTAPRAAIDGYRVAGKTGTAQKPDPTCGCYRGGYWATFAGIAPADDPRLVISVVIDEAKGGGHGGAVAGPLFKDVMTYALTSRGVAPTGRPVPKFDLTAD